METASSSPVDAALDRFAGLCAVGQLSSPALEEIRTGLRMALKVSGSTWWEADEYPVAVWAGDRNEQVGGPNGDDIWLRLGDETILFSELSEEALLKAVPAGALDAALDAIGQAAEMFEAANDALSSAETSTELAAVLEQMKEFASESACAVEYLADADGALERFELHCRMGLLTDMAVSESDDTDLTFDLAADTVDPATGETVRVRVFWAPVGDDFEHAFELAGETGLAHDQEDVDRLLAGHPEGSREHYIMALACLHTASDAVEEYAAAKVGMAAAAESTVESPLLHEARHELAHRVHTEVAAELDRRVKEM